MTARGLDWLQVALVTLGLLLALVSAESGQPTAGRICLGAGFGLHGAASLVRGRILIGNRATLLTGLSARLAGGAFLIAGLLIALAP